ncbi:hypothetical protein CVT25_002985 [Psilocybe cyanescens]|uniref:Uncharacterized protein n=1 Tax=Psilocybe cyanescens TaxID=93625 RepID=A0A409WMV7_PSICY|nr:hypothetical protein CVT25_002985 [Psilocybe cyanescens]
MRIYDPREVIVDNNNSRIRYSPEGWKIGGQGVKNGKGGTSDMNSLHVSTGKASLSYSFRGSKGRILGTPDIPDSSKAGPSWQCSLDGRPLQPVAQSNQKNKDWLLCEWDESTPVGSHTVTLNVTSNGESGVGFDHLLYQPDTAQAVKNSTIYVPHSDPAIKYGSGWKIQGDSHIATSGATNLSFSFIGRGLSWYGVVPTQSTQNFSVHIDNEHIPYAPIVIDKNSKRTGNSQVQFNWSFFQTPPLEYGQHNLTVVSEGTPDLTPLALSHLVLADSVLPSQTISSSITTPSMSIAEETSSSKGKHHSEAMTYKEKMIIGVVIGGLVFFFLVLFTFLFFRRRRIRLNKTRCEESAGMRNTSQFFKPGHQVTIQPVILSHEYPFARQSPPQLLSNQYQVNPAKRLTTSSSKTLDRPNSLFPIARLSALPTKGEPGTPRTYRPYISRRFRFSNFSSNSRQTTTSSITLLPSPKRSFISLPDDDQTVVMGHRDSGVVQCHSRPPEALPPYTAR